MQPENRIKEFADKYPPDVVLFIGAGASVGFGMPAMNQFFSLYFPNFSENTVRSFIPKKDMDVEDIILLCMKEYYKIKGTYDLEDIIAYMETLKGVLNRPTDLPLAALKLVMLDNYGPGLETSTDEESLFSDDILHRFTNKVEEAQEILTLGLFKVYGKRIEPATKALIVERYTALFDLITGAYPGNIMVFTTNYDPCLDIFLKTQHIPLRFHKFVKTGFGNEGVKRGGEWNIDNYFDPHTVAIVGYFNLHGSVLWKKKRNAIYCNQLDETTVATDIKNVQLTMPLLDKGQDEFTGKMYTIYDAILKQEKNATFICIGYSWRDERLRNITIEFLNKKLDSKFIYIDPAPKISQLQGTKQQRILQVPVGFDDPKAFEVLSTYLP